MKNTLKNRLMVFGVSYVVAFVIARIYRNKQIQEAMLTQQMMLDYHIKAGHINVL